MNYSDKLPFHHGFGDTVPIRLVVPQTPGCLHRFFDTCPISPSGRFFAAFRLLDEQNLPAPGDEGAVVVVDMETGEEREVARTRGWEPQMGANLQWGRSDEELVFNDVDTSTWTPHGIILNPFDGKRERFAGGVYHVSPNGKWAAASSLEKMRRTQLGYGVLLPDGKVGCNRGLSDEDGLFITDLASGERRLLCSIRRFMEEGTPVEPIDNPDEWEFYGFHSKWSPGGDHLIFTIRWYPYDPGNEDSVTARRKGVRYNVFTISRDGSDLRNAVPSAYWERTGHHINWYPDGESLSMNLDLGEGLRFVRVGRDGSDLRPILGDVTGSGHPTVHPSGKLLTDAYVDEPVAFPDGTVPLRWVDMKDGSERCIGRLRTNIPGTHQALRVDPHPAWTRDWKGFVFNAAPNGTRQVFLADMSALL